MLQETTLLRGSLSLLLLPADADALCATNQCYNMMPATLCQHAYVNMPTASWVHACAHTSPAQAEADLG